MILDEDFESYLERRREPRFPFWAQTRLSPVQEEALTISCQSKDLSLHGVQCVSFNPVNPDEHVDLLFELPVSKSSYSSKGKVIWCKKENNVYTLGIRLYEEIPVQLSFSDIERMLLHSIENHKKINYSYKNEIDGISQINFHNELYWGTFFLMFNSTLFNNCNKLIYDTNLSIFYMQKLENNFTPLNYSHQTDFKRKSILNNLQNSYQLYTNLSKIFGYIATDLKKGTYNDYLHDNDLNKIVINRIENIKMMIKSLGLSFYNEIKYIPGNKITVQGSLKNFIHAIDFLILHSVQFILYRNANYLQIQTDLIDNNIFFSLKNDGARILKQNHVIISSKSLAAENDLSNNNQKKLLWLHIIINLLSEFNPKIIVESESGNNCITLCLSQ